MRVLFILVLISFTYLGFAQKPKLPASIAIDGYTLKFKKIDSVEYTPVYSDQSQRDSIIELHGYWKSRIHIENYVISSQNIDFMKRKNEEILWTIELANGQILEIKSKPDWGISDYNFEHYYPKEELLVFFVRQYEGGGYLLVDRKSGIEFFTVGPPIFSPNRNYFICLNEDTLAHYTTNGLELFEMLDGIPKRIFFYDPKDLGPKRAKWLNDYSLNMEFYSFLIWGYPHKPVDEHYYKHYRMDILGL